MTNLLVLTGRTTKDVELRYTQNGVAVATVTIAIDRSYEKDGKKVTDFLPVTLWRTVAENTANYVGKGSLISVTGTVQQKIEQGQDGKNIYSLTLVGNEVRFISTKEPGSSNQSQGQQQQYNQQGGQFNQPQGQQQQYNQQGGQFNQPQGQQQQYNQQGGQFNQPQGQQQQYNQQGGQFNQSPNQFNQGMSDENLPF